ncbi:MAG TPA: BON domain-containing protein [Burkholderiaceae bacterium]
MKQLTLKLLAAAMLASTMTACVPLVLGSAAVGTALVATDRRTSGAQLEDEGIELRSANRLADALGGDRVHINVTSYNRQALLTGEVPTEQARAQAEQTVARVDNVRSVVNELGVMGTSTLTQRSSDTLVTGQVKAAMIDARDLYPTAFKVVTERGVVYLMGRVTQAEADRVTEVVRGVSGVQKVVRLFETISEEERQRLLPKSSK